MLSVGTVGWLLWYYFDTTLDKVSALATAATGGLIGTAYGFLPERTKSAILGNVRPLITSEAVFLSLAGFTSVVLVFGFVCTRTVIGWKGELPAEGISIDGALLEIKSEDRTYDIWGLPFTERLVSAQDLSRRIKSYPFFRNRVTLTDEELYAASPAYRQVTDLLRLSLYQYVENRYLAQAQNHFANDPLAKKFFSLSQVFNLLRICLLEDDIARTGDLLLERFTREYPRSNWKPLLRACVKYGRQDFQGALLELGSPPPSDPLWAATYRFFKGVNQLKRSTQSLKAGSKPEVAGIDAAIAEFDAAAVLLEPYKDSGFGSVARPSAQIFRGIAHVYLRDLDSAKKDFAVPLISKSAHPGIRARAYNDLGYVALASGDVDAAKENFAKALVEDSTFPYARTNLGYAYMADGDYDKAKKMFQEAVDDKQLQIESKRDVVLAEVAVAHLNAETGVPSEAPAAYAKVLKELRLFDFSHVQPYQLRMAHIHAELGDKLYQDPKYYGLEVFALAMYSKAYLEAQESRKNGAAPESANKVAAHAQQSFKELRTMVAPSWFIFTRNRGFFASINDVNRSLGN
ncbi:tetratricopeptide repeat protein [Bradyrhizobium sp. 200]|uniref:tetratricopeptide repeat protein n=1 Tax=Bradyrhizobium sp. 200 TaxID=2782665 RepID=UPI001FFFDC18|nr:tetratricopeptide repeat protein [Bradyrhizobium sp. 200]UPJ49509.1 tetratricopeptide repeat protein [Bradyrhizobium sp. 200]